MEPVDIILNSIQNNVRQVEILSQNVANANTPGYQGQQVFSLNNGTANAELVSRNRTGSDGGVKVTGRALDIALLDTGFLLVNKSEQPAMTRHGRLFLDDQGTLMHSSGGYVVGQSGAITLPDGDIQIDGTGKIYVNGEEVDRLTTVEPSPQASIQASGHGLYVLTGEMVPSTVQVKQGAINDASVSVSQDMVRLIELSRHTQSLQKAVQAIDQIANAGINELGKR